MEEIIKKIKSRGYWRILFTPMIYKEERISPFSECKKIVEKNAILLRGWDYPHFPSRRDDDTSLDTGDKYYQGWIDWNHHKEIWRMYQSGQFIHYRALWEDWDDEALLTPPEQAKPPMVELGVTHTIFQITEIFEFLLGLAKEGIYKEGARISISLCNTENRRLWIDSPGRVSFMVERKIGVKDLEFKKEYNETELIENSTELARETILYFFSRFEWVPSEELLIKDQQELLKRRR